jgi:Tfp pilus assembly protein PilX
MEKLRLLRGARTGGGRHMRGFILIDVAVALVIIAIAWVEVMSAVSGALRIVAAEHERLVAFLEEENRRAESTMGRAAEE